MLLYDPSNSIGATPIHSLYKPFESTWFLSVGLFISATFALASHWLKRPYCVWALYPQQIILFITAFGCLDAIIFSHYADGVIRPMAFIAVDQIGTVFAFICHTVKLYRLSQST